MPVIIEEYNLQICPVSKSAIEQSSSIDTVSVLHQRRRSLTPSCKGNSRNGIKVRSFSEPPLPRKNTSATSVQQILNEYHVFPSKTNTVKKKSNRPHFPSVITH